MKICDYCKKPLKGKEAEKEITFEIGIYEEGSGNTYYKVEEMHEKCSIKLKDKVCKFLDRELETVEEG